MVSCSGKSSTSGAVAAYLYFFGMTGSSTCAARSGPALPGGLVAVLEVQPLTVGAAAEDDGVASLADRAHRKLDPKLTLPYRPYHTHDEEQKLTPGQVYEVDVEVWPTCIVLPKGYRIGLSVRGTDYVYPGEPGAGVETLGKVWTGVGPFTHAESQDRPPAIFGGDVTLHAGPGRQPYVLLPIIPKK